MKPSIDVLALTNPMLGALAVRSLAIGHTKCRDRPIDVALVYVAVPILFTPSVSHDLFIGTNKNTGFLNWLARNQHILPGFPQRAIALRRMSTDWIRFGVQYGLLSIDRGTLAPRSDGLARQPSWLSSDPRGKLLASADRLGYWLGGNISHATVFAALGVRP